VGAIEEKGNPSLIIPTTIIDLVEQLEQPDIQPRGDLRKLYYEAQGT